MDAHKKLRLIDTLTFLLTIISFAGIAYILIMDNFQFLFNWKLLVWVGAISIVSFFLIRKRQNVFAETL